MWPIDKWNVLIKANRGRHDGSDHGEQRKAELPPADDKD